MQSTLRSGSEFFFVVPLRAVSRPPGPANTSAVSIGSSTDTLAAAHPPVMPLKAVSGVRPSFSLDALRDGTVDAALVGNSGLSVNRASSLVLDQQTRASDTTLRRTGSSDDYKTPQGMCECTDDKTSSGASLVCSASGLEPSSGQAAADPSLASLSSAAVVPRKHRVLVVEDADANLKLLVGLLKRLGYDADGATDGQLCVDLFEQWHRASKPGQPFDLVLM